MRDHFPDPDRGPYVLVERLGAGGSGEVFRALRWGGLGRDVCIKRLSARVSETEARAEMREEARLLGAVRHANVIALLDSGEDRMGTPFLVLELVRGAHLGLVREDPRLDTRLAVHIACGVLRALAAVSREIPGLVHRDVSPQNILVSSEGEVKLADFGIALTEGRARWTLPNFIKGKLGYMSPEQVRGEPLDGRTDLYAVGVVLYELLAGVRPCHPARGMEELRATVQGRQVPIDHVCRVPPGLASAIHRLCAFEPEKRFRVPEEAIAALAEWGAGDLGPFALGRIVRTRTHNGTKSADSSTTIPMETQAFHR
jgi:serine/threonine-protein kinase